MNVRKHGKYIVIDRRLKNAKNSPTEAIHALDIAKITHTHTSAYTPEHHTINSSAYTPEHHTINSSAYNPEHQSSSYLPKADETIFNYNNLVEAEVRKRVNEVKIPRNSREARSSNG